MQNIDWEQRRYEIAKDAMVAIIANSHSEDYRNKYDGYGTTHWNKIRPDEVATLAIKYSNALVDLLMKRNR